MKEFVNDNPYTCPWLMRIQGILKNQEWDYGHDGWTLMIARYSRASAIWPEWSIRLECWLWSSFLGRKIRARVGFKNRDTRLLNQVAAARPVTSDSVDCFAVGRPWGRKERFIFWLFPKDYKALPEAPFTHKDVLTTRTICYFGIVDRLRILISGRTFVEARTVCENEVGDCKTASTVFVLSPWDKDNYHG